MCVAPAPADRERGVASREGASQRLQRESEGELREAHGHERNEKQT